MKQYVLTAYDFTDANALKRRMDVRPHHLDKVKELKENGNYIAGGAILNDEGHMIGSVMMVQFENDEQMETWQNNDPYVTGKVWETIDVKPFKQAVV
ncbi:YciI family protein [Mucilaginibacter sp. PAMB04168]|uniref:YciI family protein n=1 Tax=Mucilaginibacter sp. PAMB04168 TaxID=3138567 RepID=UPI0031F691EE